jgi:hypothetical protein
MKRPWTPRAIGLAALAVLLLAPGMRAIAQQQTFSSVSSGKAPVPGPTATGLSVWGLYYGINPGYGPNHPYHPYPPCTTGHCRPVVRPVQPPAPIRPVAPPPVPRPVPPRP